MDTGIEDLRRNLDRAALFLDFDGTLSEIVDRPADARPIGGAIEVLDELSERCRLVAVVSGRSAGQLVNWLGSRIEIWGVHGAEVARNGTVEWSPDARGYLSLMSEVKEALKARLVELAIEGTHVEDKGVVLNVHYRMASDPEVASARIGEMLAGVASRFGLSVSGGRMTFELKAPVETSKGAVVLRRALEAGVDAAAFMGDDSVDLPAFEALDTLRERGLMTLRVAVRSAEAPDELIERADVVVDGTEGALSFLRGLL